MGYYVRVLSTNESLVPLSELRRSLKSQGLAAQVVADDDEATWSQVELQHPDGFPIAGIEYNPVDPDSVGAEELQEFVDELEDGKPATAAEWLRQYFTRVKAIYAIQILSGSERGQGWACVGAVREALMAGGGITQADGEGFSNEEGFHILWQFSETAAKGKWWMAILADGKWVNFEMQLSNRKQREAFLRGEVPPDVSMA